MMSCSHAPGTSKGMVTMLAPPCMAVRCWQSLESIVRFPCGRQVIPGLAAWRSSRKQRERPGRREPYRARLFPHLDTMKDAAQTAGALGVALSGAGPTVIALVPHMHVHAVAGAFARTAAEIGVDMHVGHQCND